MPPSLSTVDLLTDRLGGIKSSIASLEEERLRDALAAQQSPQISGGEALAGIIFSALPTLLGYAIGGNQGGALGAQAGQTLGTGYLGNVEKRGKEEQAKRLLESTLAGEQIKDLRSQYSDIQGKALSELLAADRAAQAHDRTLELTDIREGRADARSQASRDAAFARLQDQQEAATQLSDRKFGQSLAKPKSKPIIELSAAASGDIARAVRALDRTSRVINEIAALPPEIRNRSYSNPGEAIAIMGDALQEKIGGDPTKLTRISQALEKLTTARILDLAATTFTERLREHIVTATKGGGALPPTFGRQLMELQLLMEQYKGDIETRIDVERLAATGDKAGIKALLDRVAPGLPGGNLPPPGSRERLEHLRRLNQGG